MHHAAPAPTADRTIFLVTDGRFVTLGRHQCALSPDTRAGIQREKLAGWLVYVTGNIHAARPPRLVRVSTIEGATDAQWDAAVAAFNRIRRGLTPTA